MRAAFIDRPGAPLRLGECEPPKAGPGEVLIEVDACGVCRTDLHLLDGDIATPTLPQIPGHEIVGRVVACGEGAHRFEPGDCVGVPWLAWTCGECRQCRAGRENLCPNAVFTGQGRAGGYAEMTTADERYCLEIPEGIPAAEAAPLMCAGLIGYRSLKLAGDGRRLGLYGFGAAAHIVAQVATAQGRDVYAFTRKADTDAQNFALGLGARWAGDAMRPAPELLDAAIIFAPAGELVPAALRAVGPGGSVVCAGIHMSEIPSMPYALIWQERVLRSVANLTRADGAEFMAFVRDNPITTHVRTSPLDRAADALGRLRAG
ncbi:MAG TPA: zinc-dependent alcohol dehydrogenase family protein, partial [Reyranella sp.]|nr:zinc-dependent alcohol dehydrogenase family protein [Reyranella sp.]